MKQETKSQPFRIYLDRVPKPLAELFVMALMPGANIRHKMGYGKAYGYGSVEFSLVSAKLRDDEGRPRIPPPLSDQTPTVLGWAKNAWKDETLKKFGSLIDEKALNALAKVLGWQDHEGLLFTYPPFKKKDFATPIPYRAFLGKLPPHVKRSATISVNSGTAWKIAENLFNTKRPIHFRVYQERAIGWSKIANRRP